MKRLGLALIVGVSMLATLVLPATAHSKHETSSGASTHLTAVQRGMTFKGLTRAKGGKCTGAFRIDVSSGSPLACSHGPDPAPRGINVHSFRSVSDLASGSSTSSSSSSVQCIGDGTSGPRVQAAYVVASDVTDRYATIAPLIQSWAGEMDGALNQSAAETGGQSHIRFVTNPDCSLNVAHVVLSSTGDDDFANTITELRAQGLNHTDRKYLLWVDATVYCGIAQVTGSDIPNASNPANTGPFYARVDSGCWGRSDHLSELHELMHTLGAVEPSAPHATANYHCTDEYDVMCYSDAVGVTLTYPCASSHEWLLDCNHDDYFNTSPPSGSYLATHWNVANSVFLQTTDPSSSSPSPTVSSTPSPTSTTTTTLSGSISPKKPRKSFAVSVATGPTESDLQFSASGGGKGGKAASTSSSTLSLRIIAADGTVLVQGSGPSVLQLTAALPAGTYTWEVSGSSSVSFTLTVTHA